MDYLKVKNVLAIFSPSTEIILYDMRGEMIACGSRQFGTYALEDYMECPVCGEMWISSSGSVNVIIDDMM